MKPDTAYPPAVFLRRYEDQSFAVSPSSALSLLHASDVDLVHFHCPGQAISAEPNHRPP
jgi:hypothetical protein